MTDPFKDGIQTLTIVLDFIDHEQMRWPMNELCVHPPALEYTEGPSTTLQCVDGAMRIHVNRICCVLNCEVPYDLLSYVIFLLTSVVEVAEINLPPSLSDFALGQDRHAEFPIVGLCYGEDMRRILLERMPDGIALSYWPAPENLIQSGQETRLPKDAAKEAHDVLPKAT